MRRSARFRLGSTQYNCSRFHGLSDLCAHARNARTHTHMFILILVNIIGFKCACTRTVEENGLACVRAPVCLLVRLRRTAVDGGGRRPTIGPHAAKRDERVSHDPCDRYVHACVHEHYTPNLHGYHVVDGDGRRRQADGNGPITDGARRPAQSTWYTGQGYPHSNWIGGRDFRSCTFRWLSHKTNHTPQGERVRPYDALKDSNVNN